MSECIIHSCITYQILYQGGVFDAVLENAFTVGESLVEQFHTEERLHANRGEITRIAQPGGVLVLNASAEVLEDIPVDSTIDVIADGFGSLFTNAVIDLAGGILGVFLAECAYVLAQRHQNLLNEKECME